MPLLIQWEVIRPGVDIFIARIGFSSVILQHRCCCGSGLKMVLSTYHRRWPGLWCRRRPSCRQRQPPFTQINRNATVPGAAAHAYLLPDGQNGNAPPALRWAPLVTPKIFSRHRFTPQRPQCQGIGLLAAAGISMPHALETIPMCLSRKAPGSTRSLRFGVRPRFYGLRQRARWNACVAPRFAQAASTRQRRGLPTAGAFFRRGENLAPGGLWSLIHRHGRWFTDNVGRLVITEASAAWITWMIDRCWRTEQR